MPLFSSFSGMSARSLGLTSGAPPGPPVITSSSSTATTLTINFTPVLGSFEISRFEYSLNGAAYTGSISGSATTFTFTGLVPSNSYNVRIRAVDASGQISDPSNQITRSTTAEIPPSAPSVSLTQRESAVGSGGTASNATKLNFSYGVATAGTYPVTSYEYILYRGATLITAAAVPMAPNTNHIIEGLTPGSSHTVYVRAIATANGTTPGNYGSANASTDTEIANSPPILTITGQDTVNVTFSVSGSTGGTYGVRAYLWLVVRNSDGVWVNSGETTSTSNTVNAGTSPDGSFTVYAAAKSLVSNLQGNNSSAGGQLNPLVPAAPTIAFSGMSPNSSVNVSLTVSKPSYAIRAFVTVAGSTYEATDQGSYFSLSLGGQPFNSTLQYTAVVQNRLGGTSGNGNTITWYTPKQNQPYAVTGRSGEWILAATNSIVNPACASPYAGITWGYVPPSPNDVGYVRIDYVGVQLKTGGFSNTNTDYLFFSTPTGNVSSSLEANTDASYSLRYNAISVGGSSLSGGTIALNFLWVDGNPTGSAARIFSGYCVANGNNWFWAKDFYVQGVQTTAGSFG
jgi:hypothetical protein